MELVICFYNVNHHFRSVCSLAHYIRLLLLGATNTAPASFAVSVVYVHSHDYRRVFQVECIAFHSCCSFHRIVFLSCKFRYSLTTFCAPLSSCPLFLSTIILSRKSLRSTLFFSLKFKYGPVC